MRVSDPASGGEQGLSAHPTIPFEITNAQQESRTNWHRRLWFAKLFAPGAQLLAIAFPFGMLATTVTGLELVGVRPGEAGMMVAFGVFAAVGIAAATLAVPMLHRLEARWRRRAAAATTDLDRVLARPGVLLLRSFSDDALTGFYDDQDSRTARIEDQMIGVLSRLGAAIALGRPGEHLPETGAHRIYVADDDWQRAVVWLMERVAAVVFVVGAGRSLSWETETASRIVPPQRLIFVFPIAATEVAAPRVPIGLRRRRQLEAVRERLYTELKARLQGQGRLALPMVDRVGLVLVFDDAGLGRFLADRRAPALITFGLLLLLVAGLILLTLATDALGLSADPQRMAAFLLVNATVAISLLLAIRYHFHNYALARTLRAALPACAGADEQPT